MDIRRAHRDEGFTLVELLIVIVVLGVLATITVFAVRGIVDKGKDSSQAADEHILVTAEEAHQARFNSYAGEAELVTAGLLTSESAQHDINLEADGSSYTIVPEGTGTTVPTATTEPPIDTTVPPAPPAVVATTFAGFDGVAFGSGSHSVVIISNNGSWDGMWDAFVATTPLPTTRVIYLDAAAIDTTADVDAIVAAGASYVIAPDAIPITRSGGGGGTFVGSYLDESYSSPSQFWWAHSPGQGNNLTSALTYYSTNVVPGG